MFFYVARDKKELLVVQQVEVPDPWQPLAFLAVPYRTSWRHCEDILGWGKERRQQRQREEGERYAAENAWLVTAVQELIAEKHKRLGHTNRKYFIPQELR